MPETIRGQYEIQGEIGKGGMGQVLQARDLKLNRAVALKVLRSDQRADEERRRRFFNEAQAASALNHPNIITIYDIVSEGEHDYLVMEYVQGKTLGEVLAERALTYKDVINYGVQMADALAAAHAAGIIHRDLKPGNIMVNERGLVKVLDFGLAKLQAPLEDDDPEATQLAPMTREGYILGTCAYMSPEQAQGKPVDARSDIFAFGAVLYEMATRQRAFSGDNNITTLSAVLRDEPRNLLELSPSIPTPLERLIHRCLRKEPKDRWQQMEEVRAALAALKQSADSGILGPSASLETVAMPTPSQPEPSPFAAPPPGAQQSAGLGSAGVPKFLRNKWGLVAIAFAAAAIFGPSRDSGERPSRAERLEAEKAAEAVRKKVEAELEGVVKELDREELTNADIVKMVQEKVPDSVILGQIRNSRTQFEMSSEDVIALVKAGVPERVIEGMRNPRAIAPVPGLPPPPPPKGAPGAVPVSIPDQTPIALLLAADVPSEVEPGTPLAFTVAEDFRVGDVIVIPRGAPAHGAIVERTKKRILRGAKVNFQLIDADLMGGGKLRLRATPQANAETKNARALDFGQGRDKEFLARQGTPFIAYVDGEQQVMAPPPRPLRK